MAVRKNFRNKAYGLTNPLQSLAPQPIVSQRAPTFEDFAEVSTLWVDESTDSYYVLTSIAGGSANWAAQSSTGGGTFTDVSITGTSGTVLQVASGGNTTLGGTLTTTGLTTLNGGLTANGVVSMSTAAFGQNIAITAISEGQILIRKTGLGNDENAIELTANDNPVGLTIYTDSTGIGAPIVNIGTIVGGSSASVVNIGTVNSCDLTLGNTTGAGTIELQTPAGTNVICSTGLQFRSGSGPSITFGSDAPSGTPAQGSLYIRTDGTNDSQLLYVYNGSSWIAFTAA